MTTTDFLYQKHGVIGLLDLPVKQGPRFGARGFTDDEEERIFLFVKVQGNTPEQAAVACRCSKVTIDNACGRVKAKLDKRKAPASDTGMGASDCDQSTTSVPEAQADLNVRGVAA